MNAKNKVELKLVRFADALSVFVGHERLIS
jgi:hypothetical protein